MNIPRPRHLSANQAPFERHVRGVDYGILDELASYAVRRAQIAIYEELDRELAPLKITPPRFSSMVLIEQNPGILQSDLARIIGVGRPAMVAIIDFLQAQGWLRREAHDGDRRANHLQLTPAGRRHLARAKELLASLDRRWTASFTDADKQTLVALLDRLGPPPPDVPAAALRALR